MACPDLQDESAMLTFALIWHDHLRAHARRGTQTALCLFLPDGAGCLTAHRLRWLTGNMLETRLFRFNAHGSAGEVDARDLGNLQTRVSPHYVEASLSPHLSALLARLTAIDGVGYCPELNGGISVRCRGLEFARIEHGRRSPDRRSPAPERSRNRSHPENRRYACRTSRRSVPPRNRMFVSCLVRRVGDDS